MTLHQPTSRIFELMCKYEYYLLILESGNMSYFGYAKDSLAFFESIGYKVPANHNATDYFLDLVNRDFDKTQEQEKEEEAGVKAPKKGTTRFTADIINEAFATRCLPDIVAKVDEINNSTKSSKVPKLPGNNQFIQFFVLVKRNTFNLMRNPGIFWLRLVMYASLCLCLGTLYWDIDNEAENTQDRINLLFFCLTFFSFMSISAMPAFVEERGVYMRERMNNHYSTLSYVLADFFASIPWVFMLSLVCTAIVYPMAHLRWDWEYYAMFLLAFFVTLVVAENMMVAISATSSLFMVGLAAAAGILGLFMTLGGFVIRPDNIPVGWKWAHYGISFHTYAFEIFMHNDLHDNFNVDLGENGTGNGNEVLKDYSMDDADIGFDFFILCMMILFYRIAFYFLLKFRNRRQK